MSVIVVINLKNVIITERAATDDKSNILLFYVILGCVNDFDLILIIAY
jgi:hypothetical protein